jgi:uncharacterized protein (TIGR02599 family)
MKSPFFLKSRAGFTILEVMVASAVFIMLLGLLLSTISQTSTVTRRATEKVSAFQGARSAFELITSKLSQATMNSYWDYDSPTTPTKYIRKSELHFVVGPAGQDPLPGTSGTGQAFFFQAPGGATADKTYNGMDNLLNAYGYYIEYKEESGLPFQTSASKTSRYRLMQAIVDTEDLKVYEPPKTSNDEKWEKGYYWIRDFNSAVVAENIVFMAIWPRKATSEDSTGSALTDSYAYNSRLNSANNPQPDTANQLPPLVQVTMVAIDESSAVRFCTSSSAPTQISDAFNGLFTTSSFTQFHADLDTLTQKLTANGVNFRVFTTIVPMRESKMQ